MVIENILPIGTVVELNDVDMKVYIAGYCSESSNRQGYVYDYSGFIFPIGNSGGNTVVSFDSQQIKSVLSYGYQDEDHFEFVEKLKDIMKDIDKEY